MPKLVNIGQLNKYRDKALEWDRSFAGSEFQGSIPGGPMFC
jgi:hypothetical protein